MKKSKTSYLVGATSLVAGLLFYSTVQAQQTEPYKDVFISYYSPANVAAMAKYAEQKQLGGFILWEFRGDMPYSDKQTSLLAQIPSTINGNASVVMGYWANWSVYTDTAARAIPQPVYAVPGSLGRESGAPVVNNDFSQKLEGMNVVTYAFLQGQTNSKNNPGQIGKLYFSDPWADLQKSGSAEQDRLCATDMAICNFALNGGPLTAANMGNFNAFAKLTHSNNNQLGSLKKVFSVAGYGHDAVFEDAFAQPEYINNFVTSAKHIIEAYGLDGIDLDYENPGMTHAQSSQYLTLIKELRKQLPGKFISVTIMADPAYIKGSSGSTGFAPNVLSEIANVVDHINLMTYDFHGAFDYNPDGSGTTGFLTNLYMPDGAPQGYRFSVDSSVQAALDLRIPVRKLSIGIPAYGRAVAGIAATNGGLYQTIKASTVGVPKGDLDEKACATDIPIRTNACSGSFRYSYILNNMLGKGFVEKQHTTQNVSNGVTAYAAQWTPPQSEAYELKIVNRSSVGFNMTISTWTAPEFFNPGYGKTYWPADIGDQKGLAISLTSWMGTTECNHKLNFDADTTIEVIEVTQNSATCTVQQ